MAGGRPRLTVQSSPYLAATVFALALESRFRSRLIITEDGKIDNAPLSRRAAMRLAAMAHSGHPIILDPGKQKEIKHDGHGGQREIIHHRTHSAKGRMEELDAIEERIKYLLKVARRQITDLELLDDLSSDVLAIMLEHHFTSPIQPTDRQLAAMSDRENSARAARHRIDTALGDGASAFHEQMKRLIRAIETA